MPAVHLRRRVNSRAHRPISGAYLCIVSMSSKDTSGTMCNGMSIGRRGGQRDQKACRVQTRGARGVRDEMLLSCDGDEASSSLRVAVAVRGGGGLIGAVNFEGRRAGRL